MSAFVAGTDGRPSHTGFWHDALGRQIAVAAYGNQANDSTAFSRPATVPTRSETILVTSTEYNDNGEAFKTIDPAGKEDRTEFDDAGRRTKTIENYDDGLLFFYFSSSDLQSHMFWWNPDEKTQHPTRSPDDANHHFDYVKRLYQRLDKAIGDIHDRYGGKATIHSAPGEGTEVELVMPR